MSNEKSQGLAAGKTKVAKVTIKLAYQTLS